MGITAFPFSSVIDVPTARILGRDDAGTGSVEALTNTEIFAILGTGTPSASTYLRGDGTWATVSAGVGGSTGSVDNAVLRADGTGGATLQASAVVIPDNFTASPNATVNHASIQATGDTTNVSVSVVPKGTGSFSLQVPNGATSGGNARGANAVDLQTDRSAASQVASGQYSFTICYGNTASGTAAFAGGFAVTSSGFGSFAWGNANTISAQYATGFGQNLTVSATHAFGAGLNQSNSHVSAATLGSYSASLSVGGVFFGTSGRYSNPTAGDMHAGLIPLAGFTQGATAVNLGHGDSGATRLSVPSGSSFGFSALIHGVRSKGGEAALFHRQGIVKNIGGATSLTGSIQTIGTDINAGAASIAITADDANDALQIACTQPTGQFTGATGDAGTDVITLTGHPFANGDEICFSSLTGGAGLSTGTRYFVRDVSGNTFKVTTGFVGNTAVNFTTNITDATVDFIWYWHAVLTVNRIDFALY